MRRFAVRILLLLGHLAIAAPALAQVFEYSAGTSTLLRARGATVQVHGGNYGARVGVGLREGSRTPHLGVVVESSFGGWNVGAGDHSFPLALPTDVFMGRYQFDVRGLSAARHTARSDLLIFGGVTADGYSTPFFQASTPHDPTGLVYYERQLAGGLRGYSRTVLSTECTSIHGLEWSASPSCRFGIAAGIGSNQPFGAGSASLDLPQLSLRAAYARMGDRFRRLPAGRLQLAESDRENLQLEWIPNSHLGFGVSRQNNAATYHGTWVSRSTNAAHLGLNAGGFQLNGSLHLSDGASGSIRGTSLGIQRGTSGAFDAGLTYFHSHSGSQTHQSVAAQCRERAWPWLSFTQVVSNEHRRTVLGVGGDLTLGRAHLGVDHQTVYTPLAPAGEPAFRRSVLFNLGLPINDVTRLSAMTEVDALGQVRYTVSVSGFAYGTPVVSRSAAPRGLASSDRLIHGDVVDPSGTPIPGAAVRVAGRLVFSDSRGGFEARLPRAKSYSIELAPEEFMFPGTYEAVSMPALVKPTSGVVPVMQIVLRRVR